MPENDKNKLEYLEELTCQYCWEKIKWWFVEEWGFVPKEPVTSKEALEWHERNCPRNPESPEWKLMNDIWKCQTEARIFHCLNCQHYRKRCGGTKN